MKYLLNIFIKTSISLFFLSFLVSFTLPLYAATSSTTSIIEYDTNKPTEYTLLAPLPCVDNNCKTDQLSSTTLVTYLNNVFRLSIALAGVFAVFMIILGGFQYITTDAITGKEEGKEKIWNALQGLIMVLSSYFILNLINPRYVSLDPNVIKPLENLQQKKSDSYVDFIDSQMQLTEEGKKNIAIAQSKALQLRALSDSQYENGDFEEAAKNRAAAIEQEKIAATVFGNETLQWNTNLANNVLADPVTDQGIKDINNAKQRITKNSNNAAAELENIGDLKGAAQMKAQGVYQVATLDVDSRVAQIKSNYNSADGSVAAQVAKDQLQNDINALGDSYLASSKTIPDPTLKKKFLTESNAKIASLQSLLK